MVYSALGRRLLRLRGAVSSLDTSALSGLTTGPSPSVSSCLNRVSIAPNQIQGPNSPGFSRLLHVSSRRLRTCPYTTMGLPQTASASDIKRRYRELAKKHHPDLNPGDTSAAEKMAQISSAYQLLSDPKQKQFFDQTGMTPEEAGAATRPSDDHFAGASGGGDPNAAFMFTDFASFFTEAFAGAARGGRSPGHVNRGDDIATEVTLDFLDTAKGCRKTIHLHANMACGECSATGCSPGTSMDVCRVCNGSGTQKVERGHIIFGTFCSRCNGSGQVVASPCRTCKGSGLKSQARSLDIDFPAGVRSGMELRISGQGHAGLRGGQPGDLFVKISTRPHPQYELKGDNVHVSVRLTLKQCLLGGEVQVPTLEGKINLIVPPGTAPGDSRVLRGKGVRKLQERGYGDLIVHWVLDLPKKLSTRQRELVEEFDRAM